VPSAADLRLLEAQQFEQARDWRLTYYISSVFVWCVSWYQRIPQSLNGSD